MPISLSPYAPKVQGSNVMILCGFAVRRERKRRHSSDSEDEEERRKESRRKGQPIVIK